MQDTGITFNDWATRTQARIDEIATQQANVSGRSITGPSGTTASVGQVKAAFEAAGATTTQLPAFSDVGTLGVDYNLATWDGNTIAYLTCNLDIRGPEYLGTCTDMPVTCTGTITSDTVPYNCTKASNGTVVEGSIRNSTYR